MLAIAPFDFQAHDSFFVVGHLHYVLIGGSIFPILAAVYYYAPLIWGYKLSDKLGKLCFWLVLIGFNVTFFPMHLSGLLGMPRRVFTYSDEMGVSSLNLISTIGSFTLALGFLVFLWDLFRPANKKKPREDNPWKAGTIEWLTGSQDQTVGIRSIPIVKTRYPLWDQPHFLQDVSEGKFYLPDALEEKRETLVTSTLDAKLVQCLRVPGPTFITLYSALFSGGFFIFATYHWWTATLISGLGAVICITYWCWSGTAWIPEKEKKDIGLGVELPLYKSGPLAVGWWAMFITMLADITAFISLIFGYFFYWTINENFLQPHTGPGFFWPMVGGILILISTGLTYFGKSLNNKNKTFSFYLILILSALTSSGGAYAFIMGPLVYKMSPTSHVYPAIVWVLVGWTALHAVLGSYMQLYCIARRVGGKMTARYDADICNVSLYTCFLALTAILTALVVGGFPLFAQGTL